MLKPCLKDRYHNTAHFIDLRYNITMTTSQDHKYKTTEKSMTVLNVLEYPNPRLRKVAEPITEFTDALQTQIDDMLDTMHEENGLGLAATQVDYHHRLVVMNFSEKRNEPIVLINPEFEIINDEPNEFQEGCQS